MVDEPGYSLSLSEAEIDRYRFMAQVARQQESERWASAGLVEGARVGDIGCGPGLVTVELADVVGPRGSVIGVDRGAQEVEVAEAMIAEAGLTNATVRRADAWSTGIDPGSLDAVVLRHVLAHNTAVDQHRILAHVNDLLRPGGVLYAIDVDLTASRIDPPAPDLDELVDCYVQHLLDSGRDPAAGPKLGSLAAAARFTLVERWATITVPPPVVLTSVRPPAWAAREAMIASGHATPADVARWDAALTHFAETAEREQRAVFTPIFGLIART